MKQLLFIISLLLLTSVIFAKDHALIDSANNFYKNAMFEESIVAYEKIIEEGFESAELYYNIGNAYYKSNKIAYAVVNYERSLNLNPSDEDVIFNLRMANTHVVDKIDVLPEFFLSSWLQRLVQFFETNVWAIISMATFVISLVLLLMFFLSYSLIVRKISFWIGVLIFLVSVITFNFSKKQKWAIENEPEAVVLTPSVVVKGSPDESGTQLFLIHEGLKLNIIDEVGEWREIKLSDGNVGWVKISDLIVV